MLKILLVPLRHSKRGPNSDGIILGRKYPSGAVPTEIWPVPTEFYAFFRKRTLGRKNVKNDQKSLPIAYLTRFWSQDRGPRLFFSKTGPFSTTFFFGSTHAYFGAKMIFVKKKIFFGTKIFFGKFFEIFRNVWEKNFFWKKIFFQFFGIHSSFQLWDLTLRGGWTFFPVLSSISWLFWVFPDLAPSRSYSRLRNGLWPTGPFLGHFPVLTWNFGWGAILSRLFRRLRVRSGKMVM